MIVIINIVIIIVILVIITLLSYSVYSHILYNFSEDFTIREILLDPSEVQQFMQNMSIPPSVSEEILNTTVNTREVIKSGYKKDLNSLLNNAYTHSAIFTLYAQFQQVCIVLYAMNQKSVQWTGVVVLFA